MASSESQHSVEVVVYRQVQNGCVEDTLTLVEILTFQRNYANEETPIVA